MKPIPKRLLIHAATLRSPGAMDVWQAPTWEDTPLKHVRIEPSAKVVLTKDNTEVQLVSTLIYDCVNSSPRGIEFAAGQRVVWGGRECTVETVEQLYDERHLHHWEVGLS